MNYILLLSLLIISSCSTPTFQEQKKFLTKGQIFSEIKMLGSAKSLQADEKYTQADMVRLSNLIDESTFFDKKIANKKSRQQQQFLGSSDVDLRGRDTSVKSQDNGKCTAYAGVAAIENMMNKKEVIKDLDLSDWDAWSHYRVYSCESFMESAVKNKICDEKNYPQYGKKDELCEKTAYAMISDQEYIDDDIGKMMQALDRGNVVYLGMSTPKDIVKCKKVISPNSGSSGGGHAMLISGYYKEEGEVVAIIKNSWGPDCGDNGYHYMPMSLCKKRGYYCIMWEIKGVSIDPVVVPHEPKCLEWKTVWYAPWKKKCVHWDD